MKITKKSKTIRLLQTIPVFVICSFLLVSCVWEIIHEMPTYTITVEASPANGGSITGIGSFKTGSVITLTAKPNVGFTFDRWENYSREPTREIVVLTKDETYTAYFK